VQAAWQALRFADLSPLQTQADMQALQRQCHLPTQQKQTGMQGVQNQQSLIGSCITKERIIS